MVKCADACPLSIRSDPEPISTDEFLLSAMEAREDAERGADAFNSETFGETDGWSHTENVAANRALMKGQAAGTPGLLPTQCTLNFQKPSVPASERPSTSPKQLSQKSDSPQVASKGAQPAPKPTATVTQRSREPRPVPKPTALAPKPTMASTSTKKRPTTQVSKLGRMQEPADPLPQRKAAPRPPPRILQAGLVVGGSCKSACSASRWAERPVERLDIKSGKAEEEDDPELACYLWNRQTNRSKADRCGNAASKWGVVC